MSPPIMELRDKQHSNDRVEDPATNRNNGVPKDSPTYTCTTVTSGGAHNPHSCHRAHNSRPPDVVLKDDNLMHSEERRSFLVRRTIRSWIPSRGAPVSLLAVILMSFSDIMVEISTEVINPIQVTLIFILSQFIVSVMCALVHGIKDKSVLRRQYTLVEWTYLLSCAFFNGSARILFVGGVSLMAVGDAIAVLRSMPVFAGIIGWIFLKQALRVVDFLYIAFCIAGVVLIARPSFLFTNRTNDSDHLKLLGTALTLLGAICFAASFSIGKKLSEYSVLSYITIIINSFVTLLLVGTIWVFNREWDCADYSETLLILSAGALTSVAQMLVFWAVSRERVVVITVILASNVIYVNLLQILIIHVIPSWLSGIGAILILTACIGMSIRRNDTIPEIDTADTDIQEEMLNC